MASRRTSSSRRMKRVSTFAVWALGGAAFIYVVAAQRPHVLGWLPYVILLACPLMHVFMHHRHGDGAHRTSDEEEDANRSVQHSASENRHS
jgi:hypothetical protein